MGWMLALLLFPFELFFMGEPSGTEYEERGGGAPAMEAPEAPSKPEGI